MPAVSRIEAPLLPVAGQFALVAARFNDLVVDRLLAAATDALIRHGVEPAQIVQVRVPGAWELPLAVQHLARSGDYVGIAALGCLVRGDTLHFEQVAGDCSRGLARVMLETGVPVAHGVLACERMEDALDRAGGKGGNKGVEAALAMLEMAGLCSRLPK